MNPPTFELSAPISLDKHNVKLVVVNPRETEYISTGSSTKGWSLLGFVEINKELLAIMAQPRS